MNFLNSFYKQEDFAKEFELINSRPGGSLDLIESDERSLNCTARIRRDLMDLIGHHLDDQQMRDEPESYLLRVMDQLIDKAYELMTYKNSTAQINSRLEDDNKRLLEKVNSLNCELGSAKSEIKELQFQSRQMTKDNDAQILKLKDKIKSLERDLTVRNKADQSSIFATLKSANSGSFILSEPLTKPKTGSQSFAEMANINTIKQLESQKHIIARCEEFYNYTAERLYQAFVSRKMFVQNVFKIEESQFASIEFINRLSSIGLKKIDFVNLNSTDDLVGNFENFMSFLDYFDIILNDQVQPYLESPSDKGAKNSDTNMQALMKLQNLTKIKDVAELNFLLSGTKEIVDHYDGIIVNTLGLADDLAPSEHLLSESGLKKKGVIPRVRESIEEINLFIREQRIRLAELRQVTQTTQKGVNSELSDIRKLASNLDK